jgi:hypothetical protein
VRTRAGGDPRMEFHIRKRGGNSQLPVPLCHAGYFFETVLGAGWVRRGETYLGVGEELLDGPVEVVVHEVDDGLPRQQGQEGVPSAHLQVLNQRLERRRGMLPEEGGRLRHQGAAQHLRQQHGSAGRTRSEGALQGAAMERLAAALACIAG